MDGVNVVSLGLMAAATWQLTRPSIVGSVTAAIRLVLAVAYMRLTRALL